MIVISLHKGSYECLGVLHSQPFRDCVIDKGCNDYSKVYSNWDELIGTTLCQTRVQTIIITFPTNRYRRDRYPPLRSNVIRKRKREDLDSEWIVYSLGSGSLQFGERTPVCHSNPVLFPDFRSRDKGPEGVDLRNHLSFGSYCLSYIPRPKQDRLVVGKGSP